ncbi:unnamed protein product [Miscanthus lutarioriparius]|uniref:No apical meristem-associated C-terminal domain-containing protein n=1 Tax=Miscanthus lutarioriparius TaxID=422564 RepID=A0A811NJN5_9POAL|nr:unnamed protein product [Miscanthus lutarioriparius]
MPSPAGSGSGSRMPSPGGGGSGGRMPSPSCGGVGAGVGFSRRLPNDPPPLSPCALNFTEPHAATWDACRMTTSPAEVYEVAGDDFSPNHWTSDYSQPWASSSQYFTNIMTQEKDDDLELIHISNDPIIGNDQAGKTYWERIANDFHRNRDFESDRTPNSLEHRFGIILKECMKFQGYYKEVERRHPSGVPYKERLLEAHERKQSKEKLKKNEGEDEYKDMMQTLVVLKTEEYKMKKERWDEDMMLEQHRIEVEERRLQWEQEQKVMFCDVTTMDDDQRAYVKAKRARIVKEMSGSVSETASGESGV